jgi:hypothetical protein
VVAAGVFAPKVGRTTDPLRKTSSPRIILLAEPGKSGGAKQRS